MQGGEHNMILGKPRSLRDKPADLNIVIELDTDIVDRHKDERFLAVSHGNGVEIEVIAYALCGSAVKVSRKVGAERRRNVDSCKSCF